MERQIKGIWIPIEIWENKELTWNEKILLLEIDSFTSKNMDCFIRDGNMANGQHRLNAIIKCGRPIQILVVRGCDEDSFITYDSGRNRKISDAFALSGILNYINISSIITRYFLLHNDLNAISKEGRSSGANLKGDKKKSRKDFLDEYELSPELYQKAYRLAKSCVDKMRLMKVSEVGGLYVYLIKDKGHSEDVVESFFRMLFFKENILNNTIHTLRDKIIQDRMSNNTMTARYKSAIIAKTWNAYITGKELKVLLWSESNEGKILFT